jgi:hypothetical protein
MITRRGIARFLFGCLLAAGTVGCDRYAPQSTESGNPNWKPPLAAVEIPEIIKRSAETPFPADGKIHVIGTKGRINVKPETAVCYFPGGYSVDNDKLFDALNQSNLFNGRGRLRPAVKGRCEFTRDVVLFRGERSVNHNGYSKFVLSVWQKDVSTSEIAYWIAGIERTEGVNPRAADMKPDEYTSLEEVRRGGSAGYDQADLSDAFIGYVSGQ